MAEGADHAVAVPGQAQGPGGDGVVDWGFAERIAQRVAGREPLADSYHRVSLVADFAEVTEQAGHLVTEFTGLRPTSGAVEGLVVDRQEWVSLNLASFQRLFDPIAQRFGPRLRRARLARLNQRVAGAETGVLIGWFAQRVLGQYDLLAAGDGADGNGADGGGLPPGRVYYVGPNVLALEKRYGFRPHAFRLWIALHEVTHLVQFRGVPWLRAHFLGLVDEALGLIDPDPRRLVAALRHVLEEVRAGRNPLADGGLMTLLAGPEQRALLRRVQALMALLEGHGNHVMNCVGHEHVEGQAGMAKVLKERRSARGMARHLQRVLGVELKLRQYDVGERFIDEVAARAGPEALAAAWRGPEYLPDLDELSAPERWLARVGDARS